MLTARDLIDCMSPTTLAGLIADIESADFYATMPEVFEASQQARQALVANVGEKEAAELLEATRI